MNARDEMEYLVPDARTEDEITLEQMQGRVTRGHLADKVRKALIQKLYDEGRSQREISERLSRASVAAGGPIVTENSVFKLLMRARKNNAGGRPVVEGE